MAQEDDQGQSSPHFASTPVNIDTNIDDHWMYDSNNSSIVPCNDIDL